MGPPDTHVVDLDLVTSLRFMRARFWSEGGLNSQFGGLLLRDDSNCSKKSTRNPAEDLHSDGTVVVVVGREVPAARASTPEYQGRTDRRVLLHVIIGLVNVGRLSAKTSSCIVVTRIQTLFPPSASASTVASISIVPPSTTMVSALPFILNLGY